MKGFLAGYLTSVALFVALENIPFTERLLAVAMPLAFVAAGWSVSTKGGNQ